MQRTALFFLVAIAATAHPMGNLSVNHYARLQPTPDGVEVTYALDLAEIPTFELMQTWGVKQDAPKDVLHSKAQAQASEWVKQLKFSEDGKALQSRIESTEIAVIEGAGNLPVFRITTKLLVPAHGGKFDYEDGNYPTRAGWREIVVAGSPRALIKTSTNSDRDISNALTAYPQNPTAAPPQDSRASFDWSIAKEPLLHSSAPAIIRKPAETPVAAAPTPVPQEPAARGDRPPDQQAAGTIQRGDRVSKLLQLLRTKDISWSVFALLLMLAFWFGALHALEPGHGKTMAAAYLVGSRGTPKHAVILGAAVTFTHTMVVFLLGLGTMFLSQYVMPDKITKWLGVISGVSIIWIGGILLWKRSHALLHAHSHHHHHGPDHPHHDHDAAHAHAHAHGIAHTHNHEHDHEHDHPPTHTHSHDHGDSHSHDHSHSHSHGGLTHTHDGHTHSHMPEGDITMGSLIALGASGGLAPCPSALILLLSAISVGKPGLGLVLLVAFSLGLAIVLTLTGLTVLYAKNLLPERKRANNVVFRYMPVVSAAAIVLVGIVMTGVSMGWLPTIRFFS